MTTWYEDKWQTFECGCAVIRKCAVHNALTFERQNEMTGVIAERDWEQARADRLQEAVNVAREALVQIQNYYRGHPQQASIAEKALREMDGPPPPPPAPRDQSWRY